MNSFYAKSRYNVDILNKEKKWYRLTCGQTLTPKNYNFVEVKLILWIHDTENKCILYSFMFPWFKFLINQNPVKQVNIQSVSNF